MLEKELGQAIKMAKQANREVEKLRARLLKESEKAVAQGRKELSAARRKQTAADKPHEKPLLLGYDAVGVVKAVGGAAGGFSTGDRVWYAGDAGRPGSYAELQCVDHRIASPAPTSVSAEAGLVPVSVGPT